VSELQRKQLLSSLGLNQTQLQQLAGLLGNDHIKHIAKDKLQQLREANPGQHVVSVLAKQVLQLQPALGGPSPSSSAAATANGFVAAFGPVLPEVKSLVAAAVQAVGGSAPEPAAPAEGKPAGKAAADKPAAADAAAGANGGAASEAAADNAQAAADGAAASAAAATASNNRAGIYPVVARMVSRAVAKVVTAAEQGLDLEDLTEADLDAFLEGEEFEVSHAPAEDEEAADEPADGAGAGAAAAAGSSAAAASDSSPAASAASQVERCKRAMLQYSLKGAAAPVSAGSGDRWLLLKRNILMKSVGLEDMSKTPAHVLLQPLRLAVYAQLGLSSVTEYMCLIDEQWRSWANGRAVEVPPPPKREKRGSKKSGRGGGGGGAAAAADGPVHPAVKKLVAAVFAKILGTDKPAGDAAADATEPGKADSASSTAAAAAEEEADSKPAAAAADDADKPAAAEDEADKPAAAAAEGESSTAADASAAAAAAAAAAGGDAVAAEEDDGIDPAVRKLVSTAIAKAVAAANRAASRANKSSLPYEQLPKVLPQKPTELASLLLRRLRALDKSEQQFTKTHEKLLMLQVRRCHSCDAVLGAWLAWR
jgi:hypothetical protein